MHISCNRLAHARPVTTPPPNLALRLLFAFGMVLLLSIIGASGASAQMDIEPKAGSMTADPNSSGVWAWFDVYNNSDYGDYASLDCGVDGAYVTACSGPTFVYVDAWSVTYGDQSLTTGGSIGTGGVSLSGFASFGSDEGSWSVTVQGSPVVIITPDALPVGTSPSSNSGYGFTVANGGTAAGTIQLSASCVGVVSTCTLMTSQVTLSPGQSTLVGVKYATTSTGSTGTVTLHGTAGSSADDGSISVTLETAGDLPPLQGTALVGPGIERFACLTIAAGTEGAYECGDLRLAHGLPTVTTKNKARTPTFLYNSQAAHPYPLVRSLVTVPSPLPDAIQATLAVNGTARATASYSGTNWVAGSTRQIVLGFDGINDATGSYPYTMTIQKNVGGTLTTIQTDTGHVVIVNRSAAKLGSGWWLAGLDRLINQSDSTKLFIGGDGSTRIYYPVSGRNDMWSAPQFDHPDYIKRQTIGGTSYLVLYLPHGARVFFDAAAGLHRKTVNRLGDTTFFAWNDACEQLTSITVPLGHAPTYQFNYNAGTCAPLANVVQYAGTLTRTMSFTWDAGQTTLRSITDTDGRTTQYVDDPSFSRRIVKRINTLNDTVYYTYDGGSKLRQVTLSMRTESPIITTYYAAETRGLSGSAAIDTALAYTLLDGPRTDVNDTTQFWLDRFGAPRRIKNALGYETNIVRGDARWPGLATQVTDPTGFVKQATYDVHGNVATLIGVNPYGTGANATTRYEWDLHWDLVSKIVEPMSDSTAFAYDPNNGNRVWQQPGADPQKQVSFVYNSLGLVRSTETPGPPVARDSVDYDASGNARLTQSPIGKRTYIDRDAFGRDTLTRTALNASYTSFLRERHQYDAIDGDTLSITTGDGASDSVIVRKHYDAARNLDSLSSKSAPDINAIGWVTHAFTYDAARRQRLDTLLSAQGLRTSYDPAGNILSGGRENAVYTYDVVGRALTRAASDNATFTYDPAGRILSANNSAAHIWRSYFPNGALKTDSTAVSASDTSLHDFSQKYGISYAYDLDDRRTALIHPTNLSPVSGGQTSYAYDAVTGALSSATDVFGNGFSYSYDAEGRIDTLTSITSSLQKITDARWYDGDGELTRRKVSGSGSGAGNIRNDTLTYDMRGKALSNGTDGVTYTPLGALSTSTLGAQQESFTPDALGNMHTTWRNGFSTNDWLAARSGRQTMSETFVTGGRDTSWFYYAAPTGALARTFTSHFAGWVVNSQQEQAVTRDQLEDYTSDNKLMRTSVTVDSNPQPVDSRYHVYHFEEMYRYDALGRRIEARVWRTTNCSTKDPASGCENTLIRTIWDGSQMLYEIRWVFGSTDTLPNNWSTTAAGPGNSTMQGVVGYTYGLGIDQPLDLFKGTQVVVPHANWRGMLDQGTCPTAACDGLNPPFPGKFATAYGLVGSDVFPNGPPSWYGSLIGGMTDASGYLYRRNRYLDPSTGRFTQEDPSGLAGGINLYRYALGDPVNFADPFGLWPPPVHREMMREAFGYLGPHALERIQAGSQYVDRALNQGNENSYQHSMKAPNESNVHATTARNNFIAGKLSDARAMEAAGKHDEALFLFGEAIHPLMDMTSPFHTDEEGNPRVWDVLSWSAVAHGRFEEHTQPTAAQRRAAHDMITAAYKLVFTKK